jgi:hypothetical protein
MSHTLVTSVNGPDHKPFTRRSPTTPPLTDYRQYIICFLYMYMIEILS